MTLHDVILNEVKDLVPLKSLEILHSLWLVQNDTAIFYGLYIAPSSTGLLAPVTLGIFAV